jgi:AcrR family transcriptional regulator
MKGKDAARIGRPTAEESAAIEERLLLRVWQLYVEGGYANVSYDAIAAAERMSKRTIYVRYPSKEALFHAAVSRRMASWIAENSLAHDSRFDDPVKAFVELSLAVLLTPDAFAMSRILRGEDGRFPPLVDQARLGLHGAVVRLSRLLTATRLADDDEAQDIAICIIDLLMGCAMSRGALANEKERSDYLDDQLPRIFRAIERLTDKPSLCTRPS